MAAPVNVTKPYDIPFFRILKKRVGSNPLIREQTQPPINWIVSLWRSLESKARTSNDTTVCNAVEA